MYLGLFLFEFIAALVRCRYLNFAGFRSQTTNFPHTFPFRELENISKRQQSFASMSRSGPTEVVLCFDSARLTKAGEGEPVLGLGLGACRGLCTARQNHTTVSAAQGAAAQAFAKSAWQLTFTSAFLPHIWDREPRPAHLQHVFFF